MAGDAGEDRRAQADRACANDQCPRSRGRQGTTHSMGADRQEFDGGCGFRGQVVSGIKVDGGTVISSHMAPSVCTPSTRMLVQQLGLSLRQAMQVPQAM